MGILRLEHLALSGWGDAFKDGHLADASHLHACYATSVTLRSGGLTPFFLRPLDFGQTSRTLGSGPFSLLLISLLWAALALGAPKLSEKGELI
jgi:hypothetical protein